MRTLGRARDKITLWLTMRVIIPTYAIMLAYKTLHDEIERT